ncbi:LysR family transcriptional regulator [Aromatoleum toluclasticum]|uniref:LysR family transcriptional regulator n=1 Tax=Aromatoleum toluclasticum TaxID=92003 RepID=UPI001D189E1D|nr:LysR family transcriptional regulator [Aromatoleum toluclasticum]MCC4113964.1 LysR family transcriptional regulator [Aromatoleum toluclasticum]
MELRHLRCFVVLAEELHFTRAAERLHIEQSPLSRTIKELEDELGALLFDRDRRGTRLTQAGEVFLHDVQRLFSTLELARENVKAVSSGTLGILRIAVPRGCIDPRLSAFLARCREEVPEVEIRLIEVPLAEQLRGLRSGSFNMGFANTADVGDGIVAEPIWIDPLVVAVSTRHPLLVHKQVPLEDLIRYPLVMVDPRLFGQCNDELSRLLLTATGKAGVVEHVASMDMMLTLVAAGYGVGIANAARIGVCNRSDIVTRPFAAPNVIHTTYLLRPDSGTDAPPAIPLDRFIARLHAQTDD